MIATASSSGVLEFLGTAVFGGIVGIALQHLLSPPLNRWSTRRSVEQARRHRRTFDYAGRPFEFDGVDVGLQVLFGTLGLGTPPEDVSATFAGTTWRAPSELRQAAARFAEQEGYYDGKVGRLHRLDVATYSDAADVEHHRLRLEISPTGYFDMLATNVALGPFTRVTAPLLAGRGGLAETRLSNMIGLDLTLVTADGHVPVFLRAPGMAALQRCWQSSSGETFQRPFDVDGDNRPDLFATARRGLRREMGVPRQQAMDLRLTAVVATPEYANPGVLMYGTLPLTTEQFEAQLNGWIMEAPENVEYTDHSMIAIDDVRELADALTDPSRRWSKQAVASLVFAHAYRTNGNVRPLAEAIRAVGSLSLEAGPSRRGVLPDDDAPPAHVRYCWRCGSALRGRPPVGCAACGQEHYRNPKPCGEAVVVRDDQVLLVRRARPPWKDHWDFPGGFCDGGEHPMHAAERELGEELGLRGRAVAYLGTWIDVYGPPALDGLAEHTANSAYLVHLEDDDAPMTPQIDEVAEARWFQLAAPPDALAFPDHARRVLSVAQEASDDAPSERPLPDRDW